MGREKGRIMSKATEEVIGGPMRCLVRDSWRCNRCGESPRRGVLKATGQRGLTCACRGYVAPRATWWRQFALRDRMWADLAGNSDEMNRHYWSLPESERHVYARSIPNDKME